MRIRPYRTFARQNPDHTVTARASTSHPAQRRLRTFLFDLGSPQTSQIPLSSPLCLGIGKSASPHPASATRAVQSRACSRTLEQACTPELAAHSHRSVGSASAPFPTQPALSSPHPHALARTRTPRPAHPYARPQLFSSSRQTSIDIHPTPPNPYLLALTGSPC